MTDKTIKRNGHELIITPNHCYTRQVIRLVVIGLLFLVLSIFLAIRYLDYWQLPLAISVSLIVPALLYKFLNADKQIHISEKDEAIYLSFSGCFKHEIVKKKDVQLVRNVLNGKPYIALTTQKNPYGRSYQISPFLTSQKSTDLYEEQILPAITQQLAINRNDR